MPKRPKTATQKLLARLNTLSRLATRAEARGDFAEAAELLWQSAELAYDLRRRLKVSADVKARQVARNL